MSGAIKTIKFVANALGNKTNGNVALNGAMATKFVETSKATAFAQPLQVKPQEMRLSIATEAGKFQMSLDSGTMLAKSIKTGEVKTFAIEPGTVLKNVALDHFEVRDTRVQPKHNFTKADPGMVNIFAHKGPDEPAGATGWGRK